MRSIVPSMCSYLIVLLVASGSWATTMVRMTDEELIERSSLIVIGQCTAASSAWMGRRLVTLATIAVYEVLKGEPHTEVTVVLLGVWMRRERSLSPPRWQGARSFPRPRRWCCSCPPGRTNTTDTPSPAGRKESWPLWRMPLDAR
jgi:hypothetical protein